MGPYVERTDPFVVVRSEGSRLFDADGRSYIDANSSWWVATLGHSHPRLVEAIAEQARSLCHAPLAGATHECAALLGEALIARAPKGLTRVFYSDDGSTALEVAIKMAIGYQRRRGRSKRTKFVALQGAFHGETLGVTALGGVEVFRRPFADVLMDVVFVAPPAADEPADGPLHAAARAFLDEHAKDIAAVVVEPIVQGATGMRLNPPSFLRALREVCDAHDIVFVADEVFTGYGRTGTFWAVEQADTVPDIICTAKGFSGGMLPMAATLASERIFEAFLGPPEIAFYYGHSFCGNPLGARVALEVLRVFEDERILEGVVPRAAKIASAFAELGTVPGCSGARSRGMIGAIDLGGGGYLGGAGWRAHEKARELGAYLRPLGDTVYIAPPLNIPMDDLDELLAIVRTSVLHAVEAITPPR
ncbi:MAG: adenosylmethionine--8-amino-7-oxononanoate transaminase [Polyangiaceae bacterium]|nr:adenosylmethionine--8-amino-7-oxononanoate transaminase [Polyangiaceae bacterium]